MQRILVLSHLAMFMAGAGVLWFVAAPEERPDVSTVAGGSVFAGTGFGNGLEERLDAASGLARAAGGEAWVVALLLDEDAGWYRFRTGADLDEQQRRQMYEESLKPFDRAVVAHVLEALGEDVDPAVLWAVTAKLRDGGRGLYSRRTLTKTEECATRPIRELAREVLVRNMRVDRGYDVEKWRGELLLRLR